MKKNFLLKSTSLFVVLFAAGTLFFTSANTKEEANNQAIAELSEKVTQLNEELTTLKSSESTVSVEGYLGEIRMFAGDFEPQYWAFCNGQLLPIEQNSALYSLLGTTYGGDGRTTFGLPDLRGRVPIHVGGYNGSAPGLSTYRLGEKGGVESITPRSVQATSANSDGVNVASDSKVTNRQPYLGVNYIIALDGVFPPRN